MGAITEFILSFVLVSLSSYIFSCLSGSKKFANKIIYFFLIFLTQIITTIEFLSLFNYIYPSSFLLINSVFFAVSLGLWKIYKPDLSFNKDVKTLKDKILLSLKTDKVLFWLVVLFSLSLAVILFLTIAVPTNSWDSMDYHIARIGFWLQNHSINHYEATNLRQLIYSVNSEILIMWSMLFLKRDYLAAMPQFLAYIGSLFVLWSFLDYLKLSTGRILWTVLISASLPAMIIEASSTQNNLLLGFLLFTSFYLYVFGTKERDNTALIFSAIAFSLGVGTKFSAFFFIPVFAVIFAIISIRERKKEFYKPALVFIAASLPAFILLASYNHILNWIEFSNPFGPQPYIDKLSADHNIKSFLANLIRYLLIFIDFTGIKAADALSGSYIAIKNGLFNILGLGQNDGLVFNELEKLNTLVHENHSKLGLLGFIIFIPLLIRYSLNNLFSKMNKSFYLGLSGMFTLGFIFTMSAGMGFCYWNNRFLLSAFVLSFPIFAYSYSKRLNMSKWILSAIIAFNFLVVPFSISSRPFLKIFSDLLKSEDYIKFRQDIRLKDERFYNQEVPFSYVIRYLGGTAPEGSKIALVFSDDDWYYPFFEENLSWKIHTPHWDRLIKNHEFNKYDYLIFSGENQNLDLTDWKNLKINYHISGNEVIYNERKSG